MKNGYNKMPKEAYRLMCSVNYRSLAIEDAEWLGKPPDDIEECVRGCIKYCPPDLHAVLCS